MMLEQTVNTLQPEKGSLAFRKAKILQIGNYPPPVCGWSMQTKLLVEEIRRRGHVCDVLNIGEQHRLKSSEYTGFKNAWDYLYQLIRFCVQGYRFQVHVNGQSVPGYILALLATLIGRISGCPAALSWRGGLHQKYFPRFESSLTRYAYGLLFRLAGQVICNNIAVKQAIENYGIATERVTAIPGFSSQHLDFQPLPLPTSTVTFLNEHHPIFFCYVSFRPEYRLPDLRQAMAQFRVRYPRAGFLWLGFPGKELPAAKEFVRAWPAEERSSLLVLGNLAHDEFLTLLSRSFAYVRTPLCDGVCASVLESLALGVPVLASDNGHRPPQVLTYQAASPTDLCAKLLHLTEHYDQIKRQTHLEATDDNIARTADWLLQPTYKAEPSRSLICAD